jgi:putative serine protease PepD
LHQINSVFCGNSIIFQSFVRMCASDASIADPSRQVDYRDGCDSMWKYFYALTLILFWSQASAAAPCNRGFPEICKQTASSVVRIQAIKIDAFRVANRVQRNIGAGVFIDATHFISNAHTIWGANAVTIAADNEQRNARVVGVDPISDIAVLEIETGIDSSKPVRWGDSDGLQVGQDVISIGHPVAPTASETCGIISGKSRILPISPMSWLTPLIQTDPATLPGSSGGPLIDRCGAVIGISSLIIQGRSGINFAIPSNIVQKIAGELIQHKRVVRPWHGIHGWVIDATLRPILEIAHGMPIQSGFLVETIEPGSPADKAGLVGGTVPVNINMEEHLIGGEIITQVNGTELDSMETVGALAKDLKVGGLLKIKFLKNGQNHNVELMLPERPILQGDVRRFSD